MPTDRAVTILHLSDMQFGRNHIFGRLNLAAPDHTCDTLAERLCRDLRDLKETESLQPDLIVVSGDLAEWGLPAEFDQAREFLNRLLDEVKLERDRVVIVPGNHDINRDLCEAYFKECSGLGKTPVEPFWKKWLPYHAFFSEFYKDLPPSFTIEEPWTWFNIDELELVVAGLNSTVDEIHELRENDPLYDELIASERFGHFGRVRERQLRWFEQRLKTSKELGWLRIGVVHHNVRRGPVDDDENLRDAEDLFRVLGPHLNLLLHGHTHDGKQDLMPNGVMILSTGSTALAKEARPEEVPNQYQLIRIEAARVTRWTRRYDVRQKRWVGDTRCSDDGRDWRIEHEGVKLESVSWFPEIETDEDDETLAQRALHPYFPASNDMEFVDDQLSRSRFARSIGGAMERICELQFSADEVNQQFAQTEDGPINYLIVTRHDDMTVEEFPVGLFERGIDQNDFDRFVQHVDARYRAANERMVSYLVYGGPRADEALIQEAKRQGIRLMSLVEFQGLIDFRAYLDRQTKRLEADPIYPGSLYVPQRLKYGVGVDGGTSLVRRPSEAVETSDTKSAETTRDGLGGPSYKDPPTDLSLVQAETTDALDAVTQWVIERDTGRFVLLLGDFGTGKTFLLRELAKSLADMPGAPVPILIELRELQKARTVNELIAQHLVGHGMENIDIRKFRYMLGHGRIALLFDGFDELAQRVTYDRAAEHFDTLMEAAGEQAKIVVTSRTQHFISDRQVKLKLLERAESLGGLRLGRLQPFDEEQIRKFLCQLLKDEPDGEAKAEERFKLIDEVKDLLGLSQTPRMLSFIADLPEEQLREAKQRLGEISSAELYRLILDRWLGHDVRIATTKGSPPTLSVDQRRDAVTQVAVQMWPRTERTMRLSELTETVAGAIEELTDLHIDPDTAAQLVGARTLLIRDAEGVFAFVHQSVMEWLVANRAAEELRVAVRSANSTSGSRSEPRQSELLTVRELSPLMADFICGLAGREIAATWAKRILATEAAEVDAASVEIAKQNALLVLERLGEQADQPLQLSGKDMRGEDLSGQDLRGANLAGADLADAKLMQSDLSNANLADANLEAADLRGAPDRG